MIYFLIVIWIIGALISTKADAAVCNFKTEWSNVWIALFSWPIVATLILFDRRPIYGEDGHGNYKIIDWVH
jgi:hypothetical protein